MGRPSLDTLGDVADDVSRKNATAFVSELLFYLLIFTFWDLEVVLHCLLAHSSRQDVLSCRSRVLEITDRSNYQTNLLFDHFVRLFYYHVYNE